MQDTKKYLKYFFLIAIIQSWAANFAHPATPTIITNLGLHDYMFGVAFAGMSITNFFFAPFWGKISDQIGRTKVMVIGGVGYAFGQAMFGMATTELGILSARMVAGFFIGAWSVAQLSYIMDNSSPKDKGKNFTLLATLQSLGGAFGFFVGGYLSEISIGYMFIAQVIILTACGVVCAFMLKDSDERQFAKSVKIGPALRSSNPLGAFVKVGKEMSTVLIILSVVTLFAGFAAVAYDQCFNFFIKDQLNFLPSDNGMLRAVLGVTAFAANMTVGLWIMRRTNLFKSLIVVLSLYGAVMIGLLIPTALPVFIAINILLYSLNALYNPLIQATFAAGVTDQDKSGAYMGVFSSIKALGMVLGSLFAGFIYSTGPRLSFLYAMAGLAIATVLAVFALRARKREIAKE